MCVRGRAKRNGESLRTMGSVRKPLAGCSLVQCGVICRVCESQTHARARSLSFSFIHKKSEARIRAGGHEFLKKGTALSILAYVNIDFTTECGTQNIETILDTIGGGWVHLWSYFVCYVFENSQLLKSNSACFIFSRI